MALVPPRTGLAPFLRLESTKMSRLTAFGIVRVRGLGLFGGDEQFVASALSRVARRTRVFWWK